MCKHSYMGLNGYVQWCYRTGLHFGSFWTAGLHFDLVGHFHYWLRGPDCHRNLDCTNVYWTFRRWFGSRCYVGYRPVCHYLQLSLCSLTVLCLIACITEKQRPRPFGEHYWFSTSCRSSLGTPSSLSESATEPHRI